MDKSNYGLLSVNPNDPIEKEINTKNESYTKFMKMMDQSINDITVLKKAEVINYLEANNIIASDGSLQIQNINDKHKSKILQLLGRSRRNWWRFWGGSKRRRIKRTKRKLSKKRKSKKKKKKKTKRRRTRRR